MDDEEENNPDHCEENDSIVYEEDNNSFDRLFRIFIYKSDHECFTLEENGLRITNCDIRGLELDNPCLVRYGNLSITSEMHDLRTLDRENVRLKIESFSRGKFLCMEILSNPTTLYFDLPNMNVRFHYFHGKSSKISLFVLFD